MATGERILTTLDALPAGAHGPVVAVDWAALPESDARRLRELGLDEGAEVEALHRGSLFSRDPLAIRVGRTRLILRSGHAAAFTIERHG